MVATARRTRPSRVHGPCENCGATYYSLQSATTQLCPNCGHKEGCSD